MEKCGVIYKVWCEECGEVYVGGSERSLGERTLEHQKSLDRGDCKSALSQHQMQTGHAVRKRLTMDNMPILDQEPRNTHRKITEAFHIKLNQAGLNRNEGWDNRDVYLPLLRRVVRGGHQNWGSLVLTLTLFPEVMVTLFPKVKVTMWSRWTESRRKFRSEYFSALFCYWYNETFTCFRIACIIICSFLLVSFFVAHVLYVPWVCCKALFWNPVLLLPMLPFTLLWTVLLISNCCMLFTILAKVTANLFGLEFCKILKSYHKTAHYICFLLKRDYLKMFYSCGVIANFLFCMSKMLTPRCCEILFYFIYLFF